MKAATRGNAGERELLLLGLLRQREMHGYQLSEFLDTHLGLFFELKKATAYSTLGKMEEKGWVESREEQEGKRPPRRVFAITEEGEALFQERLRSSLAEYRPAVFPGNVPVLFLDALPGPERQSLLEERERLISERIETLGTHMEHINHPLLDHQLEIMRTERDWVRDLIQGGDESMKRVTYLIPALLLTIGAFWIWPGFLRSSGGQDQGPASSSTVTVSRRDVGSTVLATGVIRPMVGAEVQVGSRVSGILERLNVSIGDEVQAGQVLAELEELEYQARYDQALALLETAEVESRFAGLDGDRARELHARGVISDMELEGAERSEQAARASLKQAEANARSARIQLDYTVIRAPVSGVVASVSTQVGETVAASFSSPTFVTIIDLDRLEIWAYVDETDIGRVEVGQRATFTVDTYTGTEFQGTVTAIQPKAEIVDNVVNYVTLIEIGPTEGKILRPEMTTTVNITLEGRENVLTLPNGAVRRDADGLFALVPGPVGLERRAIRTGYRGRDFTEVLDGLVEGDEVVVGSVGNRS